MAQTILPLPAEVVAQIKSSTAIVSLSGVVLELLKNSLDAEATKVDAVVDFGRGGCSIDDNGLGIAPVEFREEGGIGKLYCTSKFNPPEANFGQKGAFLASLAAMSLVTITSRHHEHRSCNSITFHHSNAINRQLPVQPQRDLRNEKHGTRVAVHNLFGNLPVRVKQRAAVLDQKWEHDRLWEALKRDVIGLVLGWGRPISLRVRDADNNMVLNFNGQSLAVADGKTSSYNHHFVLNVLSQANWIELGDRSSWVPASASTSKITIKGVICLKPVPTKRVQFICLGIYPLSIEHGHNELYDEVNRVFSLSSFGVTEDEAEVDESEKLRRQQDRRFKHEQYTNRQLKRRKGVDRYPMFYLRISHKHPRKGQELESRLLDDDTNLQAILGVLNAMLTQWLSVHHMRPRKDNARPAPSRATSTGPSEDDENHILPSSISRSASSRTLSDVSSRPASRAESRKRKRVGSNAKAVSAESTKHRAFAEWTRIKSGKGKGSDALRPLIKQRLQDVADGHTDCSTEYHQCARGVASNPAEVSNALDEPIESISDYDVPHDRIADLKEHDATIHLKDPTTKQSIALNARTGCVVHQDQKKPRVAPLSRTNVARTSTPGGSIRLPSKAAMPEGKKTPWLEELLKGWENPILEVAQQRIPAVAMADIESDGTVQKLHHGHYSALFGTALIEPSKIGRLSKENLRTAQVVAQVDKKYILLKMLRQRDLSFEKDRDAAVLVLVDQHAADERVRVELLFADLCTPAPDTGSHSTYRSKLGHKSGVAFKMLEKPLLFSISSQEHKLFTMYAGKFSTWGILFDVAIGKHEVGSLATETQSTLSVSTLPTSIAERGRTEPKSLISFLRDTAWKYAEQSLHSTGDTLIENDTDQAPNWVRQLSSCPPGLVDFINSRACRSALMFNDEMDIKQCEQLVEALSKCVFPFMCAHGRPSMVPLVDLERENEVSLLDNPIPARHDSFASVWKRWKGK